MEKHTHTLARLTMYCKKNFQLYISALASRIFIIFSEISRYNDTRRRCRHRTAVAQFSQFNLPRENAAHTRKTFSRARAQPVAPRAFNLACFTLTSGARFSHLLYKPIRQKSNTELLLQYI